MWEDKERRKKLTEESLKSMPMALMKNFDGSTGVGGYRDNQYIIFVDPVDPDTPLFFSTIDDLADAGWTIST
jgi:hypothetical protein